MYVLHCQWQPEALPGVPGGVTFWAETSSAGQPEVRRGRAALQPRARRHPFSAQAGAVQDILRQLHPQTGLGQVVSTVLRLPTGRHGPQASPELVHTWPLQSEEELALAPWEVEGLWLPASRAFTVFANLPLPEETPAWLAVGAGTRYWQMVTGLVLETLAQQKLVPALLVSGSATPSYQARWRPVLDGPQDEPRLARLAAAMPPICRAVASDNTAPSPDALLNSFIESTADGLARLWSGPAMPATLLTNHDTAKRWLRALFGPDPTVAGTAAQLQALERSVQAWLRSLQVAGTGDFRVAFRLAAPANDGEPEGSDPQTWPLHYMLQARHDPSLLVPAGEVWATRADVLHSLGLRFDQPQERLLAALGYARRLFTPIERSLREKRPEHLELSTEEAFTFLREAAPLLDQSGFGVLVPPWWNQRGARLGMRLRVKPKTKTANDGVGRVSMADVVNFQWELSVGDTTLTQDEFQALVAMKAPLVQIRGNWVPLDPNQIDAALKFWKTRRWQGEANLVEALQMGLGAEESVPGLPVEDVAFEGWLEEWMKQLTEREHMAELPQPAGLQGELRPYQRFGYSWLEFLRRYGLGACLADDMGLGKTIMAISLLQRDKELGQAGAPVLLICPTSVVGNWRREVARFAPDLSLWVHQGNDRLTGQALGEQAARHDMVVTSYALARRDAETLQGIPWRGVILDEAQNIKNPEAKQTQAIRKLPGNFRIALTGTPVENRLSELWSIMHFLNPGYLGPRERFRQSFALPIERYADKDATTRLKSLVSPFILRRVKTDPRVIQDLPEKLEMKVYCNLTEEQASLYEATVKEAMGEVESAAGIDRRGQILSMLMKLKQICNHPVQYLHQANTQGGGVEMAGRSGKLDRLAEMLEEAVSAGDRALIFTQFAEMGHMLHSYLQATLGISVLYLHGGTPAAQREPMVARFQSEGGPPVFVLSLKAGGTGLNLMHANHVFHYDRWWNPAVEDQATDRAFRIGQTRNVQVHKFVCMGTLEEMIDDLIESKRSLAQSIVGSGENWLTELSTDALRQLVTLRRDSLAG